MDRCVKRRATVINANDCSWFALTFHDRAIQSRKHSAHHSSVATLSHTSQRVKSVGHGRNSDQVTYTRSSGQKVDVHSRRWYSRAHSQTPLAHCARSSRLVGCRTRREHAAQRAQRTGFKCGSRFSILHCVLPFGTEELWVVTCPWTRCSAMTQYSGGRWGCLNSRRKSSGLLRSH
jgi:hypothetical protein